MKHGWKLFVLFGAVAYAGAQKKSGTPTNEKAQKTFKQALETQSKHDNPDAYESCKKAEKQDGGNCFECERRIAKYGIQFQDWKAAEAAATAMALNAPDRPSTALSHY